MKKDWEIRVGGIFMICYFEYVDLWEGIGSNLRNIIIVIL